MKNLSPNFNSINFGDGNLKALSEDFAVGPNSSGEFGKNKLIRRHSDGVLIKSRRIEGIGRSSDLAPSFLAKFGQGSKLNFKVLKPSDFEGRKMHAVCADKTKSVNKMSVLTDADEVVEIECFEGINDFEAELEPATSVIGLKGIHTEINAEGNSFEEELEKEERDWSLVPDTCEAVIDRNEEGSPHYKILMSCSVQRKRLCPVMIFLLTNEIKKMILWRMLASAWEILCQTHLFAMVKRELKLLKTSWIIVIR